MKRKIITGVAATGLLVAAALAGLSVLPAPAAEVHTGLGFDTCEAPSTGALQAWKNSSPFQAVGLYTSGANRACRNLGITAGYVDQVTRVQGWKVVPIHVGYQAPCSAQSMRMSSDWNVAYSQGASEAAQAADRAQQLGMGAGTPLYNNQELWNGNDSCHDAVARYLTGWTDELHARGLVSGVYISEHNGLNNYKTRIGRPGITPVDAVWFANWNGRADVQSSVLGSGMWSNHQRLHQFRGDVRETFGGVGISIDWNFNDGPLYAHGMGTPPPPRPVERDFDDDRSGDLVFVNTNIAGATEVHILDATTHYTTFLVHTRSTGLGGPTDHPNWTFTAGDHNGDGRADLYAINRNIAGATEVHVFDATTHFATALVHTRDTGLGGPIDHPTWRIPT